MRRGTFTTDCERSTEPTGGEARDNVREKTRVAEMMLADESTNPVRPHLGCGS